MIRIINDSTKCLWRFQANIPFQCSAPLLEVFNWIYTQNPQLSDQLQSLLSLSSLFTQEKYSKPSIKFKISVSTLCHSASLMPLFYLFWFEWQKASSTHLSTNRAYFWHLLTFWCGASLLPHKPKQREKRHETSTVTECVRISIKLPLTKTSRRQTSSEHGLSRLDSVCTCIYFWSNKYLPES